MEAGINIFNLAVIKGISGGNAFVDALVVIFYKNRKLSKILCKYICQASPAIKYNDTHIESAKSKGEVLICTKRC